MSCPCARAIIPGLESAEVRLSLPPHDRLTLLYRISQTFNSTLDLDQVLEHVMDQVIASTHAERGFLMLRNTQGRMEFRIARGIDRHTIASPEFQISRGLVERVASEGKARLTRDAQNDTFLGSRASVAHLGLRSILCVPLKLKDVTIGVIYVDNRFQAGIFQPDDLDLLQAIASNAATAIENARLYQVAVEKGRLERELQMGFQVQSSLIPADMPPIPGWDLAALWQPARVVSGDYYDFFPLSATSAPDRERKFALVIADVSDKGMAAALFMADTRAVVRASAAGAATLAQSVTQANRIISADAANGMFVTLCLVALDPSRELTYVNAGHNRPLVCRAETGELVELERTGIALGIAEESAYTERTVQLSPGDFLVLYTDGVTDASNAQEHEFGEERFKQIISEKRRAPARSIVAAIDQSIRDFVGPVEPFDDITLVIAKRV